MVKHLFAGDTGTQHTDSSSDGAGVISEKKSELSCRPVLYGKFGIRMPRTRTAIAGSSYQSLLRTEESCSRTDLV